MIYDCHGIMNHQQLYQFVQQLILLTTKKAFNSSSPNAAYIHQWSESILVQVMACHLVGAKPLPEPMMNVCQVDPQEQTSVELKIKMQISSLMKLHLKRSSAKWRSFCPGGQAHLCEWIPIPDSNSECRIPLIKGEYFGKHLHVMASLCSQQKSEWNDYIIE